MILVMPQVRTLGRDDQTTPKAQAPEAPGAPEAPCRRILLLRYFTLYSNQSSSERPCQAALMIDSTSSHGSHKSCLGSSDLRTYGRTVYQRPMLWASSHRYQCKRPQP